MNQISNGYTESPSYPPHYFCYPLGLVPKMRNGVQSGWRMIFDLSCPRGTSVNDGIPLQFGTLKYESFSHAICLITKAGKGCHMLKKDLKSAFRYVPISPYDWLLFIFYWNGSFYGDIYLPFGLRTSSRIYNMFGEAIHWTLKHEFSWIVSHYVDDFLAVFPPGADSLLQSASEAFNTLCGDLGFEAAPEKDELGTKVNHLGFEINSITMTATLPDSKRQRALDEVTHVISSKSVSAVSLERLLGFLNHCCEVVPLG